MVEDQVSLSVFFNDESYSKGTNAEVARRIAALPGVATVDHTGNGIDADSCVVVVKDPSLFDQVRKAIEKTPGVEKTYAPDDEDNVRLCAELMMRQVRELRPKARAEFDRLLAQENKAAPAPLAPRGVSPQ
jgi:cell division protein FtsX